MTVGELIQELQKYDENLPVAIDGDIYYPPKTYKIEISQRIWVDSNYPWNRPNFEYINLE